jgi:hypothetical protein
VSETEAALDGLATTLDDLIAAGQENLALQLTRLLVVVAGEAATRRPFARALAAALVVSGDTTGNSSDRPTRTAGRRAPAVLDPYAVYESGEGELQQRLEQLTVDQLKDVIAQHGMDRDKLAMKWRTPDRLIERIIETVRARINKGEVFLR